MSVIQDGEACRVLAFDYDGTLASAGRIAADVTAALSAAREHGHRLVLISGRTWDDLRAACPELYLFEVIVAENGAVLCTSAETGIRNLASPLPAPTVQALTAEGLVFGAGRVILGIRGTDAPRAQTLLTKHGLDWQIIHNKDAAMLLPAGIDKGTGLAHALKQLGASPDETIAVGDAENDEPLLRAAGLGIATGNALARLKAQADMVLSKDNGAGIVELVHQHLLA